MASQRGHRRFPGRERTVSASSIDTRAQQVSPQLTPFSFPINKPGSAVSASYNCTELEAALKAIQQVVQCYACQKPMNSVRTCLNGHGICWSCKNRCNKYCPLCKTMIMDNKPAMLNDIIKLLPRYCNFTSKGCQSLVLANDMDHETFCRFRHVLCRMPNCDWKGMAKDLLLHLEKFHGKDIIRTHAQNVILMSFNTNIDREGLAVIVAFNNIFWRHVRVRNNYLMQFFQYVPMEKPTAKFSVSITYYTPEDSYSKCTPIYHDIFDPSKLFRDKETFCLPRKVSMSFSRFHSGVHYNFEIIRCSI